MLVCVTVTSPMNGACEVQNLEIRDESSIVNDIARAIRACCEKLGIVGDMDVTTRFRS